MNFKIDIEQFKKQIEAFKKESAELGNVINPILDNFDLNKQETLEVCQIGKFAYKIDSDIRIVDKPQPPNPDFIIELNDNLIGLEHTQILTEDAQRYFRVKTLLDYAEQIFEQKYPNINVHATISVQNDEWNYSQKDKPKLAEQIADYVQWTRLETDFELPEKITNIKTTRHSQVSFTYKEKKWQAVYLTRQRLKSEIEKKESKILGYKKSDKQLTELWLVLLIGSLSSVSYELNESENYEMESEFDRVYLMADFDAKILRVK
tara:strand:+ start:733 stop:1521 length:789 start_codon:yes stop_codon:yes gene_type:complete